MQSCYIIVSFSKEVIEVFFPFLDGGFAKIYTNRLYNGKDA